MSETKNLGLVKAIFKQSAAPIRTDVLWYDTSTNLMKYYDTIRLAWLPFVRYQLSGALTDGAPTDAEITAIVGTTATLVGAGYRVTIRDTTGTGLLYLVESNGTNWFYVTMTKAL